jgi:hypothetical protein
MLNRINVDRKLRGYHANNSFSFWISAAWCSNRGLRSIRDHRSRRLTCSHRAEKLSAGKAGLDIEDVAVFLRNPREIRGFYQNRWKLRVFLKSAKPGLRSAARCCEDKRRPWTKRLRSIRRSSDIVMNAKYVTLAQRFARIFVLFRQKSTIHDRLILAWRKRYPCSVLCKFKGRQKYVLAKASHVSAGSSVRTCASNKDDLESINSLTTESFSVFAYYTLAQTRTRRDTMNVITMQDLAPTSRIKLTPAARVTSDNSRDESERKRIVASCLGKLLAAIGESKCSRMVSWLLKKANMTLTSTSTTRLIERKSNRQRR